MSTNILSALLPAFLAEASRLVERASRAIADMARAWEQGTAEGTADDGALGQARGALHTLRGNASMMGHHGIHAVVVELERALASAEDPQRRSPALVDLLAAGIALLQRLLPQAPAPPPDDGAVEAFTSRVKQHLAAEPPR